ncbi:DNA glycosylase/AP lyase ROS1-like [Cornus florida]|uniref:DNA glycosylase/AP lyase ROS1-like n=1 Tax=Cornus florida TaxID=4283 RepID=UPI00289FBFB4|nr:DNA glycosylase/AP lyase ROS1-like [Cornus florida]XP_059646750.1 DNA glycosylase/AP lyase ROS1-like [Cornus florida]
MDLGRDSSIPRVEDFQIQSSWIPITPVKPDSTKPEPICAEKHRLLSERSWLEAERCSTEFPQEIRTSSGVACWNSNNCDERNSDFCNREEAVAGTSRVSGDYSFSDLLALAEVASTSATGHENSNAAAGLHIPDLNFQMEGYQFESSSHANLSLNGRNCTPDVPHHESHIPSQPAYGLISPARTTDRVWSSTFSSQFSPITPEPAKRVEDRQVSCIPNVSEDERANQAGDTHENEVSTKRVELSEDQLQMLNDSSCAAVSTTLQESHNSDKGGNLGIDLNTTPQQKQRRKKHRPKVVIEGQSKRVRKPVTSKQTGNKETATGKRKYVRRNGLKQSAATPSTGVINGTTNLEAAGSTAKSCRRSLKFDSGSRLRDESSSPMPPSNLNSEFQTQIFYTGGQSKSTVQLGQGMEVMVENTQEGIARSMNQAFEVYMSSPTTPTKADPPHENLKDDNQNICTRGKCRIVFSDETHDKQGETVQMMINPSTQTTPRSPNDSNCSSNAGLNERQQARGFKRDRSYTNDDSVNVMGANYNSLPAYLMYPVNRYGNNKVPVMHFPAICKKKRTEKGHNSTTSSTLSTMIAADNSARRATAYPLSDTYVNPFTSKTNCRIYAAQFNTGGEQTKDVAEKGPQKQHSFKCMLSLGHKERLTKRRSKVPTRVRDLASLLRVVKCKQVPTSGDMQGFGTSNQPHTCMEALVADTRPTMTTRKRTKRNSLVSSVPPNRYNRRKSLVKLIGLPGAFWKSMSPIEEIVEQLTCLDINKETNQVTYQEQSALVPYNRRYLEQNALVLYRRDGTVVPFEGSFDPVRKRKPRAKVDLDDETNKVWKLLLENINSEGIDGTDEQKARWWEEERRVFRGRAESFIARMHLVQGDRRFSPWKGSVLDSVVGVFLTQNVSDHLSSSAFMSLAARFPLKSDSNCGSSLETRTSILVKETDVCRLDLEDTIKWQEEKSNHPACDQCYTILHDVAYCEEKVVNSHESLESNTCGIRSTDNSKCNLSNSPGNDLGTCRESAVNRSTTQITGAVASFVENETETDGVLSSQNSVVSSQNSVDTFIAQTADRSRTYFQSNLEAEPTYGSNSNSFGSSTSFMELLQRVGTEMSHGVDNHASEIVEVEPFGMLEESNCSDFVKKNEENCMSEHSESHIQEHDSRSKQVLETTKFSGFDVTESTSTIDNPRRNEHKAVESNLNDRGHLPGKTVDRINTDTAKVKRGRMGKEKQNAVDWDSLRKEAQANGKKRERTANALDSLDWEAVRCADVNVIANTIKERGMNNMLAERIKDFLNRLVREHGSIDLEWLRDVPPDKAKEYLLSIRGLGLKSVECVRLLTLHHLAFPVDTNVGRIAVRLGWVPLQPLPESLQLHLLELYPVLESIQKYLWPRLCKLDQKTLYELHYQMITFGKVFCTKSKPNCNACPMRGECRHFASAFASARLALPGPEEKSIVSASDNQAANQNPIGIINQLQLPPPLANQQSEKMQSEINSCEPIVEEPSTPDPIIEVPATPEPGHTQMTEIDIEDTFCEDPEEIPTIKLNIEEFSQNLQNYMKQNMELQEGEMSKALVALTPDAASIPMPKLKNVSRLRTEHQVYELPDTHPLLEGLDKREPDDPSPYLLAIWTPGETANSIQPPERRCSSQEFGELCDEKTCFSCNSIREANSQIVRGTLLIPCRTATRGSFPLNGTYFQVNEVFADHDSSINPIDIPRAWIWNLPRRTVFFGTSVTSIFKGLPTEGIQYCFWRGFVCVRGFDLKTRSPRPLLARLHFPASKLTKAKAKKDDQ